DERVFCPAVRRRRQQQLEAVAGMQRIDEIRPTPGMAVGRLFHRADLIEALDAHVLQAHLGALDRQCAHGVVFTAVAAAATCAAFANWRSSVVCATLSRTYSGSAAAGSTLWPAASSAGASRSMAVAVGSARWCALAS